MDAKAERLGDLDADYDLLTKVGSPTSIHDLKEIGVGEADLFIAVTPSESENITACLIANQLGVKNWQKRRNGWDTDTALMSFCPGVVQTLSVMIQLYTPQGGNVLIQTPVYGEFYDMAEFAGRHVIENQMVEQDGKWTVDWATLK